MEKTQHTKRQQPTGKKTNRARILNAEQTNRALEMRKAGATFRAIAQEIGKDVAVIHRAVTAAIAAIPKENAEQVLAMELERLDRMFLAKWKEITSGDNRAISIGLKIMARRAKLLGLDKEGLTIPVNAFEVADAIRKLLNPGDDKGDEEDSTD